MQSLCKKSLLILIILGLNSTMAFGESWLDKVVSDLSMVEAKLIKNPSGITLINKGSSDKVEKGDLWTIYSPAERVIDPDTGASLGDFSVPLAVCRVEKSSENFSEVSIRCLKKDCKLNSGLKAIRYKDIKTVFLDQTDSAFINYKELRSRLSHLDWQGYADQLPELPEKVSRPFKIVVVADEDRVTLWSGGELLSMHDFSKPTPELSENKKQSFSQELAPSSIKTPGFESSGFEQEIDIKKSRSVASLDHRVSSMGVAEPPAADFPYLIYLSDRSVHARSLKNEQEYKYTYQGFGETVNISVAKDGLIALNIYVPTEGMESKILRMTDGGFQVIAENIDYLLSFVRNPISNNTDLLGQKFTQKNLLGPVVYHLKLNGNSVTRGEGWDKAPGYNLSGAFRTDINDNGNMEDGFFNPSGRLVINEEGQKIWESTSSFVSPFKNLLIDDPNYEEAAPDELTVWSQPAPFRLKDGNYVALALNQADWTTMIGNGPRKGTVGILTPSGNSFNLNYLVDHFQGSIQDVYVYKDELLVAVAGGNSFSSYSQTNILALPLKSLVRQ